MLNVAYNWLQWRFLVQRIGSPGCLNGKQHMSAGLSPYSRILPVVCLVALFVGTASCHKNSTYDSHCITRIVPKVTDYGVAGAALDSIYALFASNNLSTANLQFRYWLTDTTSSPTYSGRQEQVQATQFFYGLPVFAEDKFFTFNAGTYQPGGIYDGYSGAAPGADTSGNQALPDLRSAFLAHVSQSVWVGGAPASKPFIPSRSSYTDSCLIATLGYLDAHLIPGNSTPLETALVKVWKVTPMNGQYPLVYVEDMNGAAWGVTFLVP
jgi:hypothetical protein